MVVEADDSAITLPWLIVGLIVAIVTAACVVLMLWCCCRTRARERLAMRRPTRGARRTCATLTAR